MGFEDLRVHHPHVVCLLMSSSINFHLPHSGSPTGNGGCLSLPCFEHALLCFLSVQGIRIELFRVDHIGTDERHEKP